MLSVSIPLDPQRFAADETSGDPGEKGGYFLDPSSTLWFEYAEVPGMWVACHAHLSSSKKWPGKVLTIRSLGKKLLDSEPSSSTDTVPIEEHTVPPELSLFGFTSQDKASGPAIPTMSIIHNTLLHPASAKIIKKFQQENQFAVSLSSSRNTPTKTQVRNARDNNTIFFGAGPLLSEALASNISSSLAMNAGFHVNPREGEAALRTGLEDGLKRMAMMSMGINLLEIKDVQNHEEPIDLSVFPEHLPFFGFEEGTTPPEQQIELIAKTFFNIADTAADKNVDRAERLFKGRIINQPRAHFIQATEEASRFRGALLPQPAETINAAEPSATPEPALPGTEAAQPGSIHLLAESLRLIREESQKIGKMDFSDLGTSAKDKKLIETLRAKVTSGSQESDELREEKKSLEGENSKLTHAIKKAEQANREEISRLSTEHQLEMEARESREQDRRRPLLEQIDEHLDSIRKLSVVRDGFRAAATAEFETSQLDYIAELALAKDTEVRDASELSTFLALENEEHRRKIIQLEAKLSWYRKQNADASVLEQIEGIGEEEEPQDIALIADAFKSNLDLCRYVDENLPYLSISQDAFAPAKYLDGFERSKIWAKKSLVSFLALNEYAEKLVKGEVSASFMDYASSHEAKYPLQRHRIAMEPSNTGTKSRDYRRSRTFTVSENEDWMGDPEVECYPHIRIDQARPGPRIYFSDATIDPMGKIFVGYYGEHLPNATP